MTNFPINTPLGLGDLLDRVFRLYRVHASKLILAVAIFVVPLGLLSALLVQDTPASVFMMFRDMLETGQPPVQQNESSVWAFLLSPLAYVVQGFVSLATAKLTIDALHSRPLSVKAALNSARRKFFPWLGMTILVGLALGALAVVVAIVFFILALIFGAAFAVFAAAGSGLFDSEPSMALTIGIGILAVVLYIALVLLFASPFLYFYARWSLSLPALLEEDLGPAGALGRSWNLSQANVRRAIGYMLLSSLLAFVVVGTPASILQLVAGFALPSETQSISLALISGIGVIASVLTSPLNGIATVLFYYELRVRKESYDLEMQLNTGEPRI